MPSTGLNVLQTLAAPNPSARVVDDDSCASPVDTKRRKISTPSPETLASVPQSNGDQLGFRVSPLLDLPTEIVVETLLLVDFRTLVRCREVCRRLQRLIDESISLQYQIELGVAGAIDVDGSRLQTWDSVAQCSPNPPKIIRPPLSKSTKLKQLRRLSRSWSTLSYSGRVPNVRIHNYAMVYELSGGLLVHDINRELVEQVHGRPSTLEFLVLPTAESVGVGRDHAADSGAAAEEKELTKGKEKEKEMPDLGGVDVCMTHEYGFRVTDLCLDVGCDVLVVVEKGNELVDDNPPPQESFYNVHIRSLRTNLPHPFAKDPVLKVPIPLDSVDHISVKLSGTHLGLLILTETDMDTRPDRFMLWDWVTGVPKGTISSSVSWDSFCFLSETSILVPNKPTSSLDVYSFTSQMNSLTHAASFFLPPTKPSYLISYMFARTEPQISSAEIAEKVREYRAQHRDQVPTPDVEGGLGSEEVSSQSESSSTSLWRKSTPGRVPIPEANPSGFVADPEGAVIVISVDYENPEEAMAENHNLMMGLGSYSQTFVTVRRNLLDLLEKAAAGGGPDGNCPATPLDSAIVGDQPLAPSPVPGMQTPSTPVNVPWPEWGPANTRWDVGECPARWVCYVYGSRYISMPWRDAGAEGQVGITIYDFNIRGIQKAGVIKPKPKKNGPCGCGGGVRELQALNLDSLGSIFPWGKQPQTPPLSSLLSALDLPQTRSDLTYPHFGYSVPSDSALNSPFSTMANASYSQHRTHRSPYPVPLDSTSPYFPALPLEQLKTLLPQLLSVLPQGVTLQVDKNMNFALRPSGPLPVPQQAALDAFNASGSSGGEHDINCQQLGSSSDPQGFVIDAILGSHLSDDDDMSSAASGSRAPAEIPLNGAIDAGLGQNSTPPTVTPLDDMRLVTGPTRLCIPDLFLDPVVSSLPYLMVQTHDIFEWDSVMIDGERIVGLREGPDRFMLESLDVLVL